MAPQIDGGRRRSVELDVRRRTAEFGSVQRSSTSWLLPAEVRLFSSRMAVRTRKVLAANRARRVSGVRPDRKVFDADVHDGTVRVPRAPVRRWRSASAPRPLRAAAADQLVIGRRRGTVDSVALYRRGRVRVFRSTGDRGLPARRLVSSVT